MNKIPAEIVEKISHMLGVQGVPYRRFVNGKWRMTDCYCWRSKLEEKSVEPKIELPEELKKSMNGISTRVYEEMAGEFDLDIFAERMFALAQEEGNEIKSMLDELRPELERITNVPFQEEAQWRKRLESVRELLSGTPYFPYGDIVVAGTDNQFDVLRIEETTGNNFMISTEEIIESLSSIDRQFGIVILSSGYDFVSFEIDHPPHGDQAIDLGKVLLEMCPDLYQAPTEFSDDIVELWWD